MSRDVRLLFAARMTRMFAYGALSVLLALYLSALGLSDARIGLLLSLTLAGDTAVSLWLTTSADRLGRRRALLIGAALMAAAGAAFASTSSFLPLLLAGTFGVISPSGAEVGPFLSVEQAALSHVASEEERTALFARYHLAGTAAAAAGALAAGSAAQALQAAGFPTVAAYRAAVWGYAGAGVLLAFLFSRLSPGVEVDAAPEPSSFGLGPSRRVVLRLSSLFCLDAFAGGFIIQSFMAYWFHHRYGLRPGALGALFFGANLLAAASALSAAPLARRFGLLNTMVFTHLPSNLLLMLVPLMPGVRSAVAVLLLRFTISQMDVPTRQAYVMAAVRPEERSAAAGVTGVARSLGASVSPSLAMSLMAAPALAAVPFFAAGGLKVLYDLLLFRAFSRAPSKVG